MVGGGRERGKARERERERERERARESNELEKSHVLSIPDNRKM